MEKIIAQPSDLTREKIVYIISKLEVGGAEKQLLYLMKNIDRKVYSPRIITFDNGHWDDHVTRLDIQIEIIPYRFGRVRTIISLFKALREIRPVIVHCYGQTANNVGRVAAILSRIPHIIIGERSSTKSKGFWIRLIDRVLRPFTECVISNSFHAKDYYLNECGYLKNRVYVIRNGVETNIYPGQKVGEIIGTACALIEDKNIGMQVEAVKILSQKNPNILLKIAGSGLMKAELEKRAEELGVGKNIEFLGNVNDMDAFYKEINIYIHSSFVEGLSNSVMEAMTSAKPCVVSDFPGATELIEDSVHGIVIKQNDVQGLVDAVRFMIENPDRANEMGANARSKIENEFTITKMVSQTESVYRNLLN